MSSATKADSNKLAKSGKNFEQLKQAQRKQDECGPDLELRRKVAEIVGLKHISKGTFGQLYHSRDGRNFIEVPSYELDRNAAVEAVKQWAGDDIQRESLFISAVVILGAKSLYDVATMSARELCLALVAAARKEGDS